MTLLAADQEGYAHLCDLLTLAHRNAARSGDRTAPVVSIRDLANHTDGLFALTGGHDGALSRLIENKQWTQALQFAKDLKAAFGPRLFIE